MKSCINKNADMLTEGGAWRVPRRILALALAMLMAGSVMFTAVVGAEASGAETSGLEAGDSVALQTEVSVANMGAYAANDTAGVTAFSDLSAKHWASAEVNELAAAGIVSGYPDGSFRPSATVTYGEFIKMVYTACTGKQTANAGGGAHWAENYYYAALAEEFFDGDLVSRGMLAAPIPRKHMAHIAAGVIRAADAERESADDLGSASASAARASASGSASAQSTRATGAGRELFLDITEVSENSYEIMLACEAGILNGYEDGSFGPDRTLTRAEAAAVISRLRKHESVQSGFESSMSGGDEITDNEIAEAEGTEPEDTEDTAVGDANKTDETGSAYEDIGDETDEVVIRKAETNSGIVPVKYDVYTGRMSDMGIAKIEYASENTLSIYSTVKHAFVFIILEDGTILSPVGFPGGYSSEKDGYHVFVADPQGRDLTGKTLYFMFEDGDRVYQFEDAGL